MKKILRLAALGCCLALLLGLFFAVSAAALSGPSLYTTLTDHAVQRGSRKTFDVWARNAGGEKIRATVRHNGEILEPTWDDDEKASYTLHFTEEGENLVTVSASSDGGKRTELTYQITYLPAEAGEEIGDLTVATDPRKEEFLRTQQNRLAKKSRTSRTTGSSSSEPKR